MFAVGFLPLTSSSHGCFKRIHHKSMKGILSELAHEQELKDAGEIFILPDYTDEMSKMVPDELWCYCRDNYVHLIRHGLFMTKI